VERRNRKAEEMKDKKEDKESHLHAEKSMGL
jgi:hypothetical protein